MNAQQRSTHEPSTDHDSEILQSKKKAHIEASYHGFAARPMTGVHSPAVIPQHQYTAHSRRPPAWDLVTHPMIPISHHAGHSQTSPGPERFRQWSLRVAVLRRASVQYRRRGRERGVSGWVRIHLRYRSTTALRAPFGSSARQLYSPVGGLVVAGARASFIFGFH